MTFENLNLALLSLSLTLLTLIIYYYKGRSNKIFGVDNFDPKFINNLFSRGDLTTMRVKFFLRFLSLFIIVFAIAGLKTGTTVKPVERKGVDIIFCVDISTSMNAQDVKPSRINKVKFEISKVIDGLKGDRLGIVVFSGSNFFDFSLNSSVCKKLSVPIYCIF